jgi:hypothetical protein
MESKFQLLAEEYGLGLIMQQNDLEPADVLEILYVAGMIDIDDYFFEELEVEGED